MEFPVAPVDLPDCQLNWDFLKKLFNGSQASNLISTPNKTGIKITFGTTTGTWPGLSTRANNDNVTHSLGRTPTVVLATVISSPAAGWFPVVATISYTLTTFAITAVTSDGGLPVGGTAYSVAWMAIG